MINFIIYSDDDKFITNVKDCVTKSMFNNDYDYSFLCCNQYNEEYQKISNKIYIMDLDSLGDDALNISKKIREKDYDSFLAFYTNYNDLWLYKIYNGKYLAITLFNYSQMQKQLTEIIEIFLKKINEKPYILLTSNRMIEKVYLDDIIYIVKNSMERNIHIKTIDKDIIVNKSLNEINKLLNNNFIYTHRACIINIRHVKSIDKENRIIIFDNSSSINLLSYRLVNNVFNKLKDCNKN